MGQAMVRKQIYIEARQDKMLKRWAREQGVTEAQLVRAALDHYADRPSEADEIWRREVEFMRERAKHPLPAAPRDWTREELYEERLGRYGRRSG